MTKAWTFAVLATIGTLLFSTTSVRGQEPKPKTAPLTAEQQQRLKQAKELDERAGKLYQQGKVPEAISVAKQVLAIHQKIHGEEHSETALSLDKVGWLLQQSPYYDDFTAARTFHEQALRIRKKVLGEEHEDTARSLDNLGWLLQQTRDYAAARPYHEQALKIQKKVLGEEHPDTALSFNNLGFVLSSMGDYAAARPCHEQALKIRKKVLGDEHPDTAVSLSNLGTVLGKTGDYAAARQYLEQALEIKKKILGDEHPDTVQALNGLGVLMGMTGDYAAARPYLEEALRINRKVLGTEHPDTATSLGSLGMLLVEMREYGAARPYLEEMLRIIQKAFGNEHTQTAIALQSLGYLLQSTGDYAAAQPYHEQALHIRKHVFGDGNPSTIDSLNYLAVGEALQEHWSTAATTFHQARRGTRQHVARVLPSLSAREQLTFLQQTDERKLHWALTLSWLRRDDANLATLSAEWLLNGKGLTHVALAERALLSRDARDPRSTEFVRQLLHVCQQLAQLSLSVPTPEQTVQRKRHLEELTAEEEQLMRQLGDATGRMETNDPWIELSHVRQALPARSVLIECARLNVFNFQAHGTEARWKPARYVAWIIPSNGAGDVQIVDLGDAKTIDERIEQVRQIIAHAGTNDSVLRRDGETEAVRQLQDKLATLARQIWQPLAAHVATAQTLFLSPDAALWLVPWGALPTGNDDEFLIEKFTINYLVSGRDVALGSRKSARSNQSMIFANPDFDLAPAKVLQRIKVVLKSLTPKEEETTARSLSLAGKSLLPKVVPLPGTAQEANAITPHLKSYMGSDPRVYTSQDALESVVKAIRSPRVAVLSTHGFFLPDQEVKRDDRLLASSDTRSVALTVDGKPVENPLLRYGLLLAGCNAPGAGQGTAGDDGVLTGLEIVGLDLRGTELVVLSACDTGIGQVRNGEGVAGLRQAFQLAGAEAVVATLWQIPDAQSARLMNDFFENLAAGQSKAEALRNAQLKLIESRRDKFGAAHPFFWAAFTLTGQ